MQRLVMCGVAAVWAVLSSEPAMSAAWTLSTVVAADSEFVENPRLSSDGGESVSVGVLDVRGNVAAETEKSVFVMSPRTRLTRYPRDDELNRNEYFVELRGARETSLGSWALNANVTRDTSLTTEWGGELFTQARKWRRNRRVNPSWSNNVNATTQARGSFGYSDSTYEDAANTPLAGYRYRWIDAALSRELDDQTTVTLSTYASRYESTRFGSRSDDGGGRFSLARAVTDTMDAAFELGGHRTHSSGAGSERWSTAALLTARVSGVGERGAWSASLSRGVEPSGFGALVHRDTLAMSASRAIAPRWSGSLGVRVSRDEAVQSQTSRADRTVASYNCRLNWEWTENWTIAGGLSYLRYRTEIHDDAAESSTVLVSLIYRSNEKSF